MFENSWNLNIKKWGVIFISLILLKLNCNSQSSNIITKGFYQLFTSLEIQMCSTAECVCYLSSEEKEIYTILNLFRLYPKRISQGYLQPIYNKQKNKNSYIFSLISDLTNLLDCNILTPDSTANNVAKLCAERNCRLNQFEHCVDLPSRKTFTEEKLTKWGECLGSDSGNGALGKVLALLIDAGVPNLGHRKIMLSGKYEKIGVSIMPHQEVGEITVLFLCTY